MDNLVEKWEAWKEFLVNRGTNRKNKLLEDFPYCHWCKREVRKFEQWPGCASPAWGATLDHFYAKGDKRRRENTNPVVLSCYRCNNKRGNTKPEKWANKLGINKDKREERNSCKLLTSMIKDLISEEMKRKLMGIG